MRYIILLIIIFNFKETTNEITCSKDSYFEKGRCFKCDPSCGTCRGPGNQDCTSCQPHEFMYTHDKNAESFSCSRDCSGVQIVLNINYKFCLMPMVFTTTTASVQNDDFKPSEKFDLEHSTIHILFGILSYIFIGLFIIVFLCFLMIYRKQRKLPQTTATELLPLKTSKNIPLSELEWDKKEIIGRGSYGTVYKCYWKTAGKYVAVKGPISVYPGQINRFYTEWAVLSKLRHPYVTSMLGHTFIYQLVIITELRSTDLARYLSNKTDDAVSENDLNRFCAQIADAMIYLHTKNVIHCNLKAVNILVKDEYSVEVCGFGSATITTSEKQKIDGTWTHMPLEYLTGNISTPTVFGDIWSFGVTVWQIFTMCRDIPYYSNEIRIPNQLIDFLTNDGRLEQPGRMQMEMWLEIIRCFDQDPVKRPSFNRLHSKFARILPIHDSTESL